MRIDGFGFATRKRDRGARLLRPCSGLREDGWKHGQCGGEYTIEPPPFPPTFHP